MINKRSPGVSLRELLNPQPFPNVKDKCVKPKIQAWYKPGGTFPKDWNVHINKSTSVCLHGWVFT